MAEEGLKNSNSSEESFSFSFVLADQVDPSDLSGLQYSFASTNLSNLDTKLATFNSDNLATVNSSNKVDFSVAEDADWHTKMNASVNDWLTNTAATNVATWGTNTQNVTNEITQAANFLDSFTGSNILSATASNFTQPIGNVVSKAFADASNVLSMSTSELVFVSNMNSSDEDDEDLTKAKNFKPTISSTTENKVSSDEDLTKAKNFKPTIPSTTENKVYGYYDEPVSQLNKIIRSQDAQLQRYLSFFTVTKSGVRSLLKLETATTTENLEDSKYFYFFYTDGFNIQPVKKSVTKFNYGAFSTSVALENPEGNNKFSFSLPLDLELTFWKFVTEEGLGVNLEQGIYANNVVSAKEDSIDLNFVIPETLDFSKENSDIFVNVFVIENVKFYQTSSLEFSNNFSNSVMQNTVNGVYKKLKWYHHLNLKNATVAIEDLESTPFGYNKE